jgi:hypothetical protein
MVIAVPTLEIATGLAIHLVSTLLPPPLLPPSPNPPNPHPPTHYYIFFTLSDRPFTY